MSTQFTLDSTSRRRSKRLSRAMTLAWIAVGAVAAVVVPLRVIEIAQAHSDRDALKASLATSSSVRG